MTDFTIIFRSLTARLFSTVITVLTVAVAVGLMLTLLSMRDAGQKAFERGSGNMHLLVSRDSSPLVSVLNGVFYASAPARPIAWAEYERLVSPDAPSALPLEWAIPVQLGDSYKGQPVLATVPDFFTKFMPDPQTPWSFSEGRPFEAEFEAVVGAAAARATGLKLGDSVTLTHGMSRAGAMGGAGPAAPAPHEHKEYAFKVVGILRPTGAAHDRALFINLNSSWILHAHDRHEQEHAHDDHEGEDHDHDHDHALTVADLTDADRLITGIYMRVLTRPGQEGSAVLPMVFRQLRADPTLTAAAPADQIRNLFTIVSNIDDIVLAMAAIVMISSGIGIMLALYNSMEQRRRQIAVLRVLGCNRPRIFGLVLTESAMLGALGAGVGVLLCLLGGRLVAGAMKQRLGLVIEPALPLRETVAVVAGTILLACVAGLIPAFMAYRTPVARNLKPLG